MRKWFCDVCHKEMTEEKEKSIKDALSSVGGFVAMCSQSNPLDPDADTKSLLNAAQVGDICGDCFNKAKGMQWKEIVLHAIVEA